MSIPSATAWLAAAALAAAPVAAADRFADPLDLPAQASPLAARRPLTAVTAAGGRLVAVGHRGHIVWSDDGGASWAQASVPVSTDLTSVHFASPERGWAVGHDGVVLATDDGGRSWVKQLDARRLEELLAGAYARISRGEPPWLRAQLELLASSRGNASFLDVWFADERTGFAVGAFNLLVRTDDGGRTWTPWLHRSDNPAGLHLYAIRGVADDVYVAGEQGLVLKLDLATRRFRALPIPHGGGTFFGVTGDRATVLAYGLRGQAIRSGDCGAHWRKVGVPVDASLTGATVMRDGRIVIVTQAGHVLVSADDGESFQLAKVERTLPASSVAAYGANGVVLVGSGGARVEMLHQ